MVDGAVKSKAEHLYSGDSGVFRPSTKDYTKDVPEFNIVVYEKTGRENRSPAGRLRIFNHSDIAT
jgi:hypothetical protein